MQRTLAAFQLCPVNSSSFCLTPFQFWPPLLNSSQTISALLNFRNSFRQLSNLFHLFPPQLMTLFTSSLLFSTLLGDSHLCPPRLNSSQLVSPLATSSTLPTSSHLRSTHLTSFSAHINSSHLLNSGQLFSTLLTSCHRDAYAQCKLGEAFTHSKLLRYTEKLLDAEAFTHSKFLHTASFCNAIHDSQLQHNSIRTHPQQPGNLGWCSHSTAICTDWVAEHNCDTLL